MKRKQKVPCPKCKDPLFYEKKGDNWEYPMVCPECQKSKKRKIQRKWNQENIIVENKTEGVKTLVKTKSYNGTGNRI